MTPRWNACSLAPDGLRHIHPAYGRYRLGEIEIINASLADEGLIDRPILA